MIGKYPDGSPRERALVYVTGSVKGCEIHRSNVLQGEYFSPDGSTLGRVERGTGNVKYCRPDGTPTREYLLRDGKLVCEKTWWKNGFPRSERQYHDSPVDGIAMFYYPNGQMSSKSLVTKGAFTHTEFFNMNGDPAPKPDTYQSAGQY